MLRPAGRSNRRAGSMGTNGHKSTFCPSAALLRRTSPKEEAPHLQGFFEWS